MIASEVKIWSQNGMIRWPFVACCCNSYNCFIYEFTFAAQSLSHEWHLMGVDILCYVYGVLFGLQPTTKLNLDTVSETLYKFVEVFLKCNQICMPGNTRRNSNYLNFRAHRVGEEFTIRKTPVFRIIIRSDDSFVCWKYFSQNDFVRPGKF